MMRVLVTVFSVLVTLGFLTACNEQGPSSEHLIPSTSFTPTTSTDPAATAPMSYGKMPERNNEDASTEEPMSDFPLGHPLNPGTENSEPQSLDAHVQQNFDGNGN